MRNLSSVGSFLREIRELKHGSSGSSVSHVKSDISRLSAEIKVLNETVERLLELNANKDKFFSIIAHDLKCPFNSIIGLSDLLIEKMHVNDYEGIVEYGEMIQKSSWLAMDLLTNLIEWSRLQTGRMDFNPEILEVDPLVNEVMALLNESAFQKKISISKKMQQNIIVVADKEMICTVLRNLISNAIKFTNPGGIIVISAEKQNNELVMKVIDNGVGIKESILPTLFHIETAVSTPGTQDEEGTGFGLILCKEFISINGGRIWVESKAGTGTIFQFTLPLAKPYDISASNN